MKSTKTLLIIIAVFATGMFVLPSTVSLFHGQHIWYSLNSSGEDFGGQIPCEKCHADVAEEMSQLVTIHSGETGYGRFECEYCHRTFWFEESDDVNQTIYNKYYFTYATVKNTYTNYEPGKEAHAASTVPCMYCHSGAEWGWVEWYYSHGFSGKSCSCHGTADTGRTGDWREYYYHGDRFFTGCYKGDSDCPVPATEEVPGECIKCHGTGPQIYIPPAGGFGLTADTVNDTGSMAAHKSFVERAIQDPTMEDANEACIACHTWTPVRINWSHALSLEFNATYEKKLKLPPTHYNVTAWFVNGTYPITVWGNASGYGNTSGAGWPGW